MSARLCRSVPTRQFSGRERTTKINNSAHLKIPSFLRVASSRSLLSSLLRSLLACLPACLLACLLTQGNLQDHLQIRSVYRLKDGAVTLNSPFKAGSLLGQALIGAEYLLFQSVR